MAAVATLNRTDTRQAMAKRKTTGENSRKDGENGEESKQFTLAGIRELAAQLRWHADLIDECANSFEAVGIKKTKLQAGNFGKGTKILRGFIGTQLSTRILREGDSAVKAHTESARINNLFVELLTKLGVDE